MTVIKFPITEWRERKYCTTPGLDIHPSDILEFVGVDESEWPALVTRKERFTDPILRRDCIVIAKRYDGIFGSNPGMVLEAFIYTPYCGALYPVIGQRIVRPSSPEFTALDSALKRGLLR